jgi:putative addiction module component (TIGR02574 family)
MGPQTENIMKEALQLPREARALIAGKLLESLDLDEPIELTDEWREEIARRCRELDEGAAILIPANQVLKEAGESLSS